MRAAMHSKVISNWNGFVSRVGLSSTWMLVMFTTLICVCGSSGKDRTGGVEARGLGWGGHRAGRSARKLPRDSSGLVPSGILRTPQRAFFNFSPMPSPTQKAVPGGLDGGCARSSAEGEQDWECAAGTHGHLQQHPGLPPHRPAWAHRTPPSSSSGRMANAW